MRRGIDVSSYQRSIDWDRAKEYIDFAIIRCGYGNNLVSQDDTFYHRNALECTRLKIPFGVYLFSYATNLNMAQSEVEHTLRLIKDYQLEYPVFLDVEERSQLDLPKERLVEIVRYYCEKIEEAGYYVGIYASLYTLENYLNAPQLERYDKWVAQWSKDFSYKGNSGMWQYTDNERIPGIDTRVDGDIAFYDYPKIILDNDLNHLRERRVDLKYRVGEELYLNGPLYRDRNAEDIKEEYINQPVRVVEVFPQVGIKAPYRLNIDGYAKEEDLREEEIKNPCECSRIIRFLRRLLRRE